MTTRSEDVVFASLTDVDSLEALARSGFESVCVPTEAMRPVVDWAIGVYFDSGRRQAPSREMLEHRWGDVLEAEEIDLIPEDEEYDPVEDAIDDLRSHYVAVQWQDFIKRAATDMAGANPVEKIPTLMAVTDDLFTLASSVQDRSTQRTTATGYVEALADYKDRAEAGHTTRGMTFGLGPVDQHTFGVHPGEVAVLAAGPKVGKSFFLVRVALHEWATQGRSVALFTLENTDAMTMDRLVCLHLGVDPRQWQRGLCEAEEVARVEEFTHDVLPTLPGALHVMHPDLGLRTPERMMREARLRGVDSVLIDQMTHVEHPSPGRKPRHELFNENIHEFAALTKTARDPLPLLIAHQINRAGVEAARKLNYHEMEHLAESAGMERAADWIFSLHQNLDEHVEGVAKLQVLAARREEVTNWQIMWGPTKPQYRVLREIELERAS